MQSTTHSESSFYFLAHVMLDFLGVVTKVSRRFQQDKLIVLEIPTIIDDCIDNLSGLIDQSKKSFNFSIKEV